MSAERRHTGRVMGTEFTIIGHARDEHLFDEATYELARLEGLWSRFRDDSEIAVLNRAEGRPVIVSEETFTVITAAVDATIATAGRFDPTVHDSLVALGYDRTFDEIVPGAPAEPRPAPGVAGILLDEALCAVTLPVGVRFDLGGIGKGAAADRVSGRLMDRGARGVAVAVGGDTRVRGESPAGGGWLPHLEGVALDVAPLLDGGVCTSSVGRRRWSTANGEHNHLVDPSTGHSLAGTVDTVTVIAATATQAEVLTKAALVSGAEAPRLLESFGVHASIRWAAVAA